MDLITALTAAGGASAGGAAGDPNFNQTVLLLHGDGTNGAQNNTFLDSSTNNFTITRNGNTTQGTFSPFSLAAGEFSNFFDGSGDYFSSSTALFNYTTGNAATETFTIEAWVYHTARATPSFAYYSQSIAAKGDIYFNFGINSSGNLLLHHYDGSERTFNGSSVIPLNTWTHVAVVVSGGTATLYINGVSDGTGTWYGIEAGGQNSTSWFGSPSNNGSAKQFQGYISNLRVSSTARSITVPTAPYTNDGNTVLLIEQSNRFVDNSSNGYALTVAGTPSVQPFSPFLPTAAYSASVNGGSGYFDGSGDYLSVPDDADFDLVSGTNWTIEGWIYKLTTGSQFFIGSNTAGGATNFSLGINASNQYQFFWVKSPGETSGDVYSIASSSTAVLNQWNHVAAVNNSGTVTLYVNGSSVGTVSISGQTYVGRATGIGIGSSSADAASNVVNGYVADARMVVGTAVYTSGFTPPTAPLTAITNTVLLTNFTNAGIFDNTGKNNLETVADAQIDTTTKKYGTGSMEFDGTGDYLSAPMTPNLAFGTGDMTIECWVYANTISGIDTIFDTRTSGSFGNESFLLQLNAGVPQMWAGSYSGASPVAAGSAAISTSTWTHIAFTRSSGTNNLFVDGVSVASNSNAWNQTLVTTNPYYIGQTVGVDRPFDGFIDDLRITKGVARYTSAFTPPTAAFPDL
jgi:hypothetical protein